MNVFTSKRLRHRVRTLSTLLGETMSKQHGEEFRQRLAGLIDSVNEIKGQIELLENSPEIKQTLNLLHPYTDPLHLLQVELIKRCRRFNSDELAEAHKALLVTIAGIAASTRNTG